MSGFSADWLALREPADRRARSPLLLAEVRDWDRGRPSGAPLAVIDLGAGTGASLRAIAPHLPAPQMWTLVDQDQTLLNLVAAASHGGLSEAMLRRGEIEVRLRTMDLAREIPAMDPLPGNGPCLFTASALLDLVSADWCRRLIQIAARPSFGIYAALTYDGRMSLTPPHPVDPTLCRLFNQHQRRDKGFGPALGPGATQWFAHEAKACGARVRSARSDWRLGPGQRDLMRPLVEGWRDAAKEVAVIDAPDLVPDIKRWAALRIRQAHAGALRLSVGHVDLFASW